jgi:arylsulfatase A
MRTVQLVLILCGTFICSLSAAAERPPNVVLVLVDDLGWTDLACFGSKYYETPHLDKLATQGMKFTNAYAACAVCSPTRAAVMTGRYPARTGITDWIRARFQGGKIPANGKNSSGYVGGRNQPVLCPRNPLWLESEEITVAEALKPAGYTSCHIGKWHLGPDAWYPEKQGFDFNYGGCDYGQPPSYFDPYKNGRLKQGIPTLKPRKKGEYLTDREGDEAVKFITDHKDKPFFLYFANYAVHTPIQGRADLIAKYKKKPTTNQKNATYAAMVHSVDVAVGKITKVLDELKLADNTLVIFTSDNGGLLGPTHNAPLRAGKGHPYEGGIRVPLIVRWPGVVKPGTLSREPVISVDYLPTIMEATGAKLPKDHEIDGMSLVAHLKADGKTKLDREAIFWHFPHYRGRIGPYSIVRSGDWKLLRWWATDKAELYDLNSDLSEKTDLAASQPDRVKQLRGVLDAHLAKVGARLPKKNPAYASRTKKKKK